MIQRFKLLCTPACEIAIEKLVNAFEIPRQARGTGQAPEGFACGLTAAGLAKQKPQTPKSLEAFRFGGSLAAWRMFVITGIRKKLWVLGLTVSVLQLDSPEILVGLAITSPCSASLPA